MQAKNERFEMRLEQGILDQLDAWRAQQADAPSRAEAVRRFIEEGVVATPSHPLRFSDGEKLTILMLCDIIKHLKVKSDTNPEFVQSAILDGQLWALRWQMTGVFHGYETKERDVSEVVAILDMWSFLEESYEKLPKKEKDKIKAQNLPFGSHLTFLGFDGNNETDQIGIARFLVEEMGRFSRFKGRELNSHLPVLASYRAMSRVFEPMRRTLIGRSLSPEEIIEILGAANAAF